MGREVITLNVGGCGVKLGDIVWRQYCTEHKIDETGMKSTNSGSLDSPLDFFQQTSKGYYIPRNIMIDLDPSSIENVKCSQITSMFVDEYFMHGNKDSLSNFAYGYYSKEAKLLMNKFNDKLRKLIDNCDNLSGFICNHSVAGGTGAGLGALILEMVGRDYRKKTKIGFEIYPFNNHQSENEYEVYNSLLATHYLLDFTYASFMFDNRRVYNLSQYAASYNHMNVLIAKTVSAITGSIRYWPEINMDINMEHLAGHLVPFPRLHFLIPSLLPIVTNKAIKKIYIKDAITKILIDGFIRSSFPITIHQENLTYEPPLYKELMNLIYLSHTAAANFRDVFIKKYDKKYYLWDNHKDLFEMCSDSQYFMVECLDYNAENDKCMAVTVRCNGNFTAKEVNASVERCKTNKKISFVEWCPTGFKVGLLDEPIPKINNCEYDKLIETDTVAMVMNNTAISNFFSQRICKQFDKMYEKKRFVSLYVNEGMEEGEFDEAREDLQFLAEDYLDVLSEQATVTDESDD